MLNRERNTSARSNAELPYKVAAGVVVYAGALVVLAAGFAKGGAAATDLVAVGRAEETVDNSAGAAGEKEIRVRRGVFLFANSTGDAIAQADVGQTCFVEDDETVAASDGTGTLSPAGIVRGVEPGGVWVEI
ncbi:hypothetical protein [Breoghania sp.]|uniref:hypothetical protein n=1 Tax=Breoghania sp. TaxID=2065378 RepID=UPI0029CA369B|nr:hypothetical protein [Breoghania sp.]